MAWIISIVLFGITSVCAGFYSGNWRNIQNTPWRLVKKIYDTYIWCVILIYIGWRMQGWLKGQSHILKTAIMVPRKRLSRAMQLHSDPAKNKSVNWVTIGSDNPLSKFGAKSLCKQLLTINYTLRNKVQWNSNQNKQIFLEQSAFENVVWKWRPSCFFFFFHTFTCTLHISGTSWDLISAAYRGNVPRERGPLSASEGHTHITHQNSMKLVIGQRCMPKGIPSIVVIIN